MERGKTTGRVVSIPKVWLNLEEAMKYTGWSKDYFKTLRDAGKLNFSKPYGQKMVMYRIDDIDNLIERGMQWPHRRRHLR